MSDNDDISNLTGHGVIAGFGVPGRAVAEWMAGRGLAYVVVETNEKIVARCGKTGTRMIHGDVRSEQVLLRAGIDRASIFAIAVPAEGAAVEAVSIARRLNPAVRIIARCTYISGGLDASRRGADETIVAEEIVAREFVRRLSEPPAATPSDAT